MKNSILLSKIYNLLREYFQLENGNQYEPIKTEETYPKQKHVKEALERRIKKLKKDQVYICDYNSLEDEIIILQQLLSNLGDGK